MKTEKNLKMFGRKMIVAGLAGVALLCAGLLSVHAADANLLKQLRGHVPGIIARLKAKGVLPSDQKMDLAIGLPLRNQDELAALLNEIYDPSSPNFHHYLTPEQFTEKFGPTKAQYQMVINFARVNGLTVKGTHPNRMLLDVTGKAADVEKAFHIMLHLYKHPTENRDFFAPDSEPSVSAALPILGVSGLNNYSRPHPAAAHPSGNGVSASAPLAGSAPDGNLMGKDFRNAYAPGTALTGSGQNVGLLQFDGFYSSDIAAYETLIGLTNNVPNLVIVPVDGGVPTPTPFGNDEVSLDIEMVLSMSPGVSNIYVYEQPNNGTPFVDVLNKMATDNLARQLSCSWFEINGGPDALAEQIFQQMALQGQTFFCASGDADAYTGLISFPCDSPHITLVGGTTLTMNGTGDSYASETVWNWGTEFGDDGVGSSGGVSTTYSIPSWQTNIDMPARGGSSVRRNVPDVALTGDHVWVIYGSGNSGWFGGTSCAAPLWAGFMALVNQQAALSGRAPIGFLNPAIYNIAKSSNYTNCFHDITTGNNEWSGSPNLFVATNNYDLCTGLGTPNGTNLIFALAGYTNVITHLSPPLPPYGSTLSALNGGNPNGTWQLYVLDDQPLTSGMISNGWILKLVTANPVGFSGDLALGMAVSATNIALGNTVVFTLSVTNYGPSTSSNVLISDTLPLNTIITATNADSGSVIRSGQLFNWNVGTLNTNSGSQLQFTAQLNTAGSLVNYALSSAGTPDANSDDDFASVTVNVSVPVAPVIGSISSETNGTFQMTVDSPALLTVIQASTNLVNWDDIYSNTPPFVFTDPSATNYPIRFYRAVIP